MLRFAANLSLLFTEVPLPQRPAAAKSAGFDQVEIQFPYELPLETWQQVFASTRQQLILINVPAGDLMQGGDGLACVPGREQAFATAVDQAIDYARGLQVAKVNILAGRVPQGIDREQARQTLIANLRMAVPKLAAAGIGSTIEAINPFDMPRFLLNTAADMQDVMQAVDHSSLSMQVDLYHMARMGEDLAQLLAQHWPQIGHIQFADVPGRGAPGTGKLPFAQLFHQISLLPYAGYCGAEYRPGPDTPASLGWLAAYRQ